jgi:hypothetical protein
MQTYDFTARLRSAIESVVYISVEHLVGIAAGQQFSSPLFHKIISRSLQPTG